MSEQQTGQGATTRLAGFIAETDPASLPPAALEAAKVAILDGVANLLAGSQQPVAAIVRRYVDEQGGAPEASVTGSPRKTNAPMAAFANGVFLHCLDFEIQGHPASHGTSVILPPALALAEKLGAPGRAVLEAYVIGWEVQARLRTAAGGDYMRGCHPPGVFGPLAAVGACAGLLDLDREQVRYALGIAASRAGGLFANNGTMVKSTHPGNAGRLGLESVLLARLGFTSHEGILEASQGYVDVFFRDKWDWAALTQGLGERWNLVDVGFNIKRYPAQIYQQWAIEAVATLKQRHHLQPEDVETLELEIPVVGAALSRPAPRSGLDGKFSFEYSAAIALVEDHVGIDSYSDATRFSPRVEETLGKVRLRPNPEIPANMTQCWFGAHARLKDGRELSERCRSFRGSIANPMSRDERLAKYRGCARRALAPSDVERMLALVEGLETLPDVREVTELLSSARAER